MARRCEFDPAFQWLTGLEEVNYHTLADFRVEKQQELDELFTQVLAALSKEGLITLEQVMQDGTKIKALASPRSYQKEATIREHLERAWQRVAEMGDPRNEAASPKARQAQARARQEQHKRLENALQELGKLQEGKKGEKAKSRVRVSVGDPEARVMKQPDKGLALSYNAQISRQHREDGRARDRFSGEHGAGGDTQRGDRSAPPSAECVRLSTGDESVCLPGGPAAAAPREISWQEETGPGSLFLRGKNQRLSALHP